MTEGAAICRSCGTVHRIGELLGIVEYAGESDFEDPPPGCQFEQHGAHWIITASTRDIGRALGLTFIVVFWNGILSVFVLQAMAGALLHLLGSVPAWFPSLGMQRNPVSLGMTLFLWVFLIPFIAVGLSQVGALLLAMFGHITVSCEGNMGAVFTGCGRLGRTRRFDSASITQVRLGETAWRPRGGTPWPLIELVGERRFKFGTALSDPRRTWMLKVLAALLLRR